MAQLQLCLATDQMLANLIPILRLKPDQVVIVSSEGKLEKAQALEVLLKELRPELGCRILPGLPDGPYEAITDFAFTVLEQLQQDYPVLTGDFNATGGTKLMAMAFMEVFRGDFRILYTDTAHQRIEVIGSQSNPAFEFGPLLNVETYLKANDLLRRSAESDDAHWGERAQARKPLTKHLAKEAETLSSLFGLLNKCGHQAASDHHYHQTLPRPGAAWRKALALMAEHDLLDWSSDSPTDLYFRSGDALRYLTGGWLEEYAWHCARELDAQEIYCGLQVTSLSQRKANDRNELDLVVCHGNRLLVVECKTAALGKNSSKDSQLLYKLDSVGNRVAGLFGEKLLLSALPLDHKTKDNRSVNNTGRAKAMQIPTLCAGEITTFKTALAKWMNSGHLS